MNTTETINPVADPFESDLVRARLALQQVLSNPQATYKPGTPPELGDLSCARLWAPLAACGDAPTFRTRRLSAVARELKHYTKILDAGIGFVTARHCLPRYGPGPWLTNLARTNSQN